MIPKEDLKISVIPMKRYECDVNSIQGAIVQIEHLPSGIIVTKKDKLSQVKAKERAITELEELVSFWERKEAG